MSKGEVSELLSPRYKVIGDYPNCPFSINKVLNLIRSGNDWVYEWYEHDGKYEISATNMGGYPHLFKLLAWYEERQPDEMPEYLISVKKTDAWNTFDVGSVVEVVGFKDDNRIFNQLGNPDSYFMTKYFEPATLTEYNQYLKTKQK